MTPVTSQSPVQERPPVEPAPPPSALPTPQWAWNPPPNALPPYPMTASIGTACAPPPAPMSNLVPTAAQRMGLAITSLALFIPLLAILLNFAAPSAGLVPVALGVAVGLIGVSLLGMVVVGVNVVFNWDVLRPKR